MCGSLSLQLLLLRTCTSRLFQAFSIIGSSGILKVKYPSWSASGLGPREGRCCLVPGRHCHERAHRGRRMPTHSCTTGRPRHHHCQCPEIHPRHATAAAAATKAGRLEVAARGGWQQPRKRPQPTEGCEPSRPEWPGLLTLRAAPRCHSSLRLHLRGPRRGRFCSLRETQVTPAPEPSIAAKQGPVNTVVRTAAAQSPLLASPQSRLLLPPGLLRTRLPPR